MSDARPIPLHVHDLDAEGAVLSALLLCPERLADVRAALKPEHLYSDANRRIYEAVLGLADAGRAIDLTTVATRLRDSGKLERVGGSTYLAQIVDATPVIANVDEHVQLVVDAARRRLLAAEGTRLAAEARMGEVDPAELARIASARIAAAGESRSERWSVMDAAAIFAPLEPVRHVIASLDICAGAPGMWAGFGFSGKTVAAQQAEVEIAAGIGKVFGCFAAPQGRVVHVDFEQGSRLTRERFQRLAMSHMLGPSDLEGRLSLVTMPDLYLDNPASEAALCRIVDDHMLAVVDSFRAAAPSIDENSSEARRVLDMLTRVSETTGCAFVVIHHSRKPSQNQIGGAKMAIRGSGALFDAAGSVLVFEGAKGEPVRVSHEKARASGRLAEDFELTISDVPDGHNPRAGLVATAEAARSLADVAEESARTKRLAKVDRLRSELTELFAATPELGGADSIAAKLGRSSADVRAALRLLISEGSVEATGSTRDRCHRWVGDSRSEGPRS